MKAKITAIQERRQFQDTECVAILEQESEDEEQEAARKAKDEAERESRAEKRRAGKRNVRHSIMDTGKIRRAKKARADPEEEEADEEEGEGDWAEELEIPATQSQMDGRVEKMMAAYMEQAGNALGISYCQPILYISNEHAGFDLDDDGEGDFDVLGGDDESDE